MKKSRSFETPARAGTGSAQRTGRRLGILAGAVALMMMLMMAFAGNASVAAAPNPEQGQANGKKFKATRPFVVDKDSGAVRMPTQEEIDKVVADLTALGQRPDNTLQQSTASNGAVMMDLGGGFGGILLARPNEDGTFETKCVFTIEEGAEFLGLVLDNAVQ